MTATTLPAATVSRCEACDAMAAAAMAWYVVSELLQAVFGLSQSFGGEISKRLCMHAVIYLHGLDGQRDPEYDPGGQVVEAGEYQGRG